MSAAPRSFLAPNPGPFTLEGTRSFVVGRSAPAVVDPGPDLPSHVSALRDALEGASRVTLLVTHGHADHAGAVTPLLEALRVRDVPVSVAGSGHPAALALTDGAAVETDGGELVVVATPGHARDHLAFHWPRARALFAGDLLMGSGDTTWVAGYPGCVSDYLSSLERVRELDLDVIHPAHGPDLLRPMEAIARFAGHRRKRIAQVRDALVARPRATPEELVDVVYGNAVPGSLRGAAVESLRALIDHVRGRSSSG